MRIAITVLVQDPKDPFRVDPLLEETLQLLQKNGWKSGGRTAGTNSGRMVLAIHMEKEEPPAAKESFSGPESASERDGRENSLAHGL